MPRPALELYRQLPITHKHRSLLLSVSSSSQEQIEAILPQIDSGFTGLICTYQQCTTQPIQASYLPKIINFSDIITSPAKDLIGMAAKLEVVGVKFEIKLGASQSSAHLQLLPNLVAHAKKAKLITMLEISFAQQIPKQVMPAMQAYALRVCVDYKFDFNLASCKLDSLELQQALQIVSLDNLIAQSAIQSSAEMRRMLATGISGLVVSLSELEAFAEPGRTAFQLGEAVFGPGSYQPE